MAASGQKPLLSVVESTLKIAAKATDEWGSSPKFTNMFTHVTIDDYPGGSIKVGDFLCLGKGLWLVLCFVKVLPTPVRANCRAEPSPLKVVLLYGEKRVEWYTKPLEYYVRVADATEVLKMASRNRGCAKQCALSSDELDDFVSNRFEKGVEVRTRKGAASFAGKLTGTSLNELDISSLVVLAPENIDMAVVSGGAATSTEVSQNLGFCAAMNMCEVQCAVCNVQCAMCNVQCAMCNVQCAMCNVDR
jgi:hypothetical protein